MNRVIISYRSDDTREAQDMAASVATILRERLGTDEIVLGVGSLVPVEEDPTSSIARAVNDAYALVIVMGTQWQYGAWLRDPHDPNHIAITAALRAGIRVIPVLGDDVALPTAGELPGDFALLSRQIPVVIRADDPHSGLDKLATAVVRSFPTAYRPVVMKPVPAAPEQVVEVYRSEPRATPGQPHRRHTSAEADGKLVPPRSTVFPALHALLYPITTDSGWIIKLGIATVLLLVPFVGSVVVIGYAVRSGQRIMNQMAGLPNWDDFLGDILRGVTVFAGLIAHMFMFLLPAMFVSTLLLDLGATVVYSERLGAMVRQPGLLGQVLSLAVLLVFSYFFMIMNLTGLALYLETGRFSAFFDFRGMWQQARGNFRRNIILIFNLTLFSLTVLLAGYIGLNTLVLPGLFVSAVGTIGYFYLIAYWLQTIRETAVPTSQT